MKASLVYDGNAIRIPKSMGTPTLEQMRGTELDKLGELASRICYDSLGYDEQGKPRGRSSSKLHAHILQVINHSVYEHPNFTVQFSHNVRDVRNLMVACSNRKGIWVEYLDGLIEITTNLRAILEWKRHESSANMLDVNTSKFVHSTLSAYGNILAPQIITLHPSGDSITEKDIAYAKDFVAEYCTLKTKGLTKDQAWISLYLYGSRGFTHEQVRHRQAMSQRSTRYVDEDGSDYVLHPLVEKYLLDESVGISYRDALAKCIDESTEADRVTYRVAVEVLEAYGLANGLDKQTARKQARGAARGHLGNALASEMIYSAPASGWQWILSQRLNPAADAEIRAVYEEGLPALKSSQYGHFFSHYETVPSPDGMGVVLAS